MGSCISIGKQKQKSEEQNCIHGDDKLVISQSSTSPSPILARKVLSPSKSPASITSTSSLSSATSCTSCEFSTTLSISSSSSSSSSCSTSISSVKERSLSNEFLRSCAKENPRLIGLDAIRESSAKSSMAKRTNPQKIDSSPSKRATQVKQSNNQERLAGSTPKKRAPNNSSVVIRQKSLVKEIEKASSFNHRPSRAVMSPSPSRRFSTNSLRVHPTCTTKENHYKSALHPTVNSVNSSTTTFVKKEVRENHDLSSRNTSFKNKGTSIQQINSKTAETTVDKLQAKKDTNSILMEDINNPHIALDCFIFL